MISQQQPMNDLYYQMQQMSGLNNMYYPNQCYNPYWNVAQQQQQQQQQQQYNYMQYPVQQLNNYGVYNAMSVQQQQQQLQLQLQQQQQQQQQLQYEYMYYMQPVIKIEDSDAQTMVRTNSNDFVNQQLNNSHHNLTQMSSTNIGYGPNEYGFKFNSQPQIQSLNQLNYSNTPQQYQQCYSQQQDGAANSQNSGPQRKRRRINKPYQDTKNVPKNYTKAILRYLKHNQDFAIKLLGSSSLFKKFIKQIESKKDKIISIKEFRSLFSNQVEDDETDNMRKVFRIMAFKFCREEVNTYLKSNRKIKQNNSMFKYRRVIQLGLQDPDNFYSWKICYPIIGNDSKNAPDCENEENKSTNEAPSLTIKQEDH